MNIIQSHRTPHHISSHDPQHDNKTDATSSLCLVFGSETTGFNEIMEDIRDESLVYIPQETSNIRSFNLCEISVKSP